MELLEFLDAVVDVVNPNEQIYMKWYNRVSSIRVWLPLIGAMLWSFPAIAQLSVAYGDKAISITGAKPNTHVAVYGVAFIKDVTEVLLRTQTVSRASADGTLTFPVSQPAFRSIWVIVDLTSADYVISTPPGFRPRRIQPPADALAGGDGLRNQSNVAEVFIARRGMGAWVGRAADSSASDDDHRRDGGAKVALRATRAVQRDGPSPPNRLAVGDVVFMIDLDTMEFWALQVRPGDLGEGSNAN